MLCCTCRRPYSEGEEEALLHLSFDINQSIDNEKRGDDDVVPASNKLLNAALFPLTLFSPSLFILDIRGPITDNLNVE